MVKRGTPAFFLVFGRIQKRCHETPKMVKSDTGPLFSFFGRCHKTSKMMKRGTPAFVFWAHSEAVSRFIKNDEEGHPRLRFWAHSKAVSRFIKNDEEGHRALVKHRDARAGERHQLVGHQMNEQVRHRAVQALEGEPGKVARAGADATEGHLGHALGGKAGNEGVAQVAHAADVDVAHRARTERKWKCSEAPFMGL